MKIVLLLTFVIVLSTQLFSQDETPPSLNSIIMVPDSAFSGDSISIVMTITDDIEGVSGYGFPQLDTNFITYARVSNPDSNQAILIYNWINTTGSTYYSRIKIPQYTFSGNWKVDFVYAVDRIGNFKTYRNNIDFITSCYITSNSIDTIPPVLNSLTVSPTNANNGDTVLVIIDAWDNLSGISGNGFPNGNNGGNTIARFSNPYGIQEYYVTDWILDTNNIYVGKAKIDLNAEAGTWSVDYITLFDQAGNNATFHNFVDFDGTVNVNSPGVDYSYPVLDSINIVPNYIYRGDSISIIMYARDNISGISGNGFPNGSNGGFSYAEINNNWDEDFFQVTNWTQIGNNAYEGKFYIPSFAHVGTWTVCSIYLTDQIGNDKTYSTPNDYYGDFYVHDINEGIDDILNENLITVFPNPIYDFLSIESNLKINYISLFSITGKLLEVFKDNTSLINLQEFEKGIYILLISTEEGTVSKRIIKL